jgi:hypothetical protein
MNKPVKRTKVYYDYDECQSYIQKKYNINIDDYAGKFTNNKHNDDSVPYQSFWNYVVDNNDLSNGSFFSMSTEELIELKDWQREIVTLFLNEFGESTYEDDPEYKEILFYVDW